MLLGEVVALARIRLGVEELPLLQVEVTPRFRGGGHGGRCLPALVPDRPRAEHRVELRLLLRGGVTGVEAVREADPLDRLLGVAVHLVGQLDAEAFVERRDDVDRVRVLPADLARAADALRPGDDGRTG